MPRALVFLAALLLASASAFGPDGGASAQEKAFSWPHDFVVEGRVVRVHAPSLESVSDTRLKGRSRVSIKQPGEAPPSVGSAWFTATISTDKQARLIRVVGLKVDRTKIPDLAPAEAKAIAAVIEKQVGSAGIVLPLDRVLAVVPAEASAGIAKQNQPETKSEDDRVGTER